MPLKDATGQIKDTVVLRPIADEIINVSAPKFDEQYNAMYFCESEASLGGKYEKQK